MRFIDPAQDPWQSFSDAGSADRALDAASNALLTLEQWHAVRDHWPAGVRTGVTLPNTTDVLALLADLPRLSLVVLQFPKWTDGRAYSQARLLRSRLAFGGEIRAVGDVLVDMLPLLQRTGFDAAQLRADQDLADARRALGFSIGHYQVAASVNTFAPPSQFTAPAA